MIKKKLLFTVFLQNMYSKYKRDSNYYILYNDEKVSSIFRKKEKKSQKYFSLKSRLCRTDNKDNYKHSCFTYTLTRQICKKTKLGVN